METFASPPPVFGRIVNPISDYAHQITTAPPDLNLRYPIKKQSFSLEKVLKSTGKGTSNEPRCFEGEGFEYVPARTWEMERDRIPYVSS